MPHSRDGLGVTAPLRTNIVPLTAVVTKFLKIAANFLKVMTKYFQSSLICKILNSLDLRVTTLVAFHPQPHVASDLVCATSPAALKCGDPNQLPIEIASPYCPDRITPLS